MNYLLVQAGKPCNNYYFFTGIGILRLRQKLDRENEANLTVTVIAKDNVAPQQTSTATIFVEVLDINDNNPVFDTYLSSYNIAENSDLDTSIARITATDRDDENFGKIVYSFNVQNDDNALKINRPTVSSFLLLHLLLYSWMRCGFRT